MNSQNTSQPKPIGTCVPALLQLLVAVLLILSLTPLSAGQSLPLGSRLSILPSLENKDGAVSMNDNVWIEIKFMDSRGSHAAAPTNIKIILTATVLTDLTAAKQVAQWQQNNPLDNSNVLLPKNKDAVVVQGDFPAGWATVWVRVKSERAGVVRIFAEGEKLITGNSLINVQGPSKLAVTVNPTSIRLPGSATIEISLLDYSGSAVPANANYLLTVTATSLVSLNRVKQVSSSQQNTPDGFISLQRSLEGRQLILRKGISTATLTGLIQKGKSSVKLLFRSESPGTVRIYVQGNGLFPAGIPVAVSAYSFQFRQKELLSPFSELFQHPQMIPAVWQQLSAKELPPQPVLPLKLVVEGYNVSEEIKDIYRFKVFLKDQNDQSVGAESDIVINLKIEGGKGKVELSPQSLRIPKGKFLNERPVEVKSSCDRLLTLRADASVPDIVPLNEPLNFNPPRRATWLDVNAAPETQISSGWNSINLRVSALNDCKEPIRAEEENLGAGRLIKFYFDRALYFDKDDNTLTIPAGSFSEGKKVYSSESVEVELTASADSNTEVTGKRKVFFYFPWAAFISAVVGGLLWPLISALPKLNSKSIAQGALSGGVGFGLALFGAIVTEQAKLGDLTVNLARLPVRSWFPAAIMGFIGYLLIAGAISLPSLVKKILPGKDGKSPEKEQ